MMEAMLIYGGYWWFILPGILLGLYAQIRLSSAYGKYAEVPTHSGISGAEAAREILDRAGLQDVEIHEIPGHLTDHYDPTKRALFLSSDNFHNRSLAAVGVAAHETGHALQHQAAYAPLKARMALVPVTQFASNAAMFLWLGGMFIGLAKLASLGILIYGIIAVFQLITLPVEFDASRRAKQVLLQLGLIDNQEHRGVERVLGAAALTYVAAMVTTFFYLLQFVMMARDNRD